MRFVALIGILLIGCQTPVPEEEPAAGRLDERLQPYFTELKAALDEGADDVARAILQRLRPRCQDPLSLKMADAYERILEGRAIRDSTDALLLIEEAGAGFEIRLRLKQDDYQDLLLSPAYARVEWAAQSVDTLGRQSTQVGGRVLGLSGDWDLPAGETLEVVLGVDSPRIGEGALAVRVEWKVSLGAGSATVGGARFPLQGLRVKDGVIVRLSKELSTDTVEPAELFRYALGGSVKTPALLERAVRIHPSQYQEALDLLAEMEPRFSPSALSALSPVMAWLTGSSGLSARGEDWRSWLQQRLILKEQGGNLDLPDDSGR